MADQKAMKKRLKALMNRPENQVCSDCPERQPRWASLIVPPPGAPPNSLPIGAFCCLECSGSHRRLGVHISFVRSVNLDSWKEKEVLAMENGGNAKVNAIFEARLPSPSTKPSNHASGQTRERFIRDKYERRKYYDPAGFAEYAATAAAEVAGEQETSPSSRRSVGPPSDAAKQRLEQRRARIGKASSSVEQAPQPSSRSRGSSSSSNRRKVAKAPASAPPPSVDLLDLMGGNGGGAPEPSAPAARAPAPEQPPKEEVPAASTGGGGAQGGGGGGLDLFDFLTTGTGNGQTATNNNTQPTEAPTPQKSANSADILSLYNNNTSSAMHHHHQPDAFGNFGGGGGMQQQQQPQQQPMNSMMMGGVGGATNPMMMMNNPGNSNMQQMTNMMQQMQMAPQQQQQQPQMNPHLYQQQMMMMQQQQQMMMMQQQQQQQQQQRMNNSNNMNAMGVGGGYNNMMPNSANGYSSNSMGNGLPVSSLAMPTASPPKQQQQPEKEDPFAQFGSNVFRS